MCIRDSLDTLRRRHPLRLRQVACSSLNGSYPTIAYGVIPHFSSPLDTLRRRHPLRLMEVISLSGRHPTIAYGVFPQFSSSLDDSQGLFLKIELDPFYLTLNVARIIKKFHIYL